MLWFWDTRYDVLLGINGTNFIRGKNLVYFRDRQRKIVVPIGIHDAGASWDSFTQALTNEKPSMLQFKPRKALAIFNDSYDLRLQMRPYDASKKILIEEIDVNKLQVHNPIE